MNDSIKRVVMDIKSFIDYHMKINLYILTSLILWRYTL